MVGFRPRVRACRLGSGLLRLGGLGLSASLLYAQARSQEQQPRQKTRVRRSFSVGEFGGLGWSRKPKGLGTCQIGSNKTKETRASLSN